MALGSLLLIALPFAALPTRLPPVFCSDPRISRKFVADCGAMAWWIRKTDLRVQDDTSARLGAQEGDAAREAD